MIPICLLLLLSPQLPNSLREDPPAPAVQSERVLVVGTRVKLSPPAGFVPGVGFTGFNLPDTGVSIMVTEMPGPSADVAKGMDEKGLRRSGMTLVAREDATISGRKGALLQVAQTQQGVEYEKWMAVFGDEKNTVIVMGSFPKAIAEAHSDALKRVVLACEWDPTLPVDPFTYLDWTVDVQKDLPFAGRVQKMLTFSVEGAIPGKDPSLPLLIVAPSIDGYVVGGLKKYAEERVLQTVLVKKLEIQRSEAAKVAGLEAWEIVAACEHEKSKTPMCLYQLMIVRPEGYILVQGRCKQDDAKQYAPLFEKAARSWKPKPPRGPDVKPPAPK